jgi:hypothetical protein
MLVPPSLEMLDRATEACLERGRGRAVVLADLWDVDTMSGCAACRLRRIAHLRDMNRTGRVGRRVTCSHGSPQY